MPPIFDRRRVLVLLGAGSLSVLFGSPLAWGEERPPVPGALLLANIRTPPFRDAVVLMFEHGSQGSQGLIINKSDHRSLGRIMTQLNLRFRDQATFERFAASEVLYGGPVARDRYLSLIHMPPGPWAPSWNLGKVAITSDPALLRDLAAGRAGVTEVVGCLGVSGWGPGQLQGEVDGGSWRVVHPQPEALVDLLFETPLHDRFEKASALPEGFPTSTPRQAI